LVGRVSERAVEDKWSCEGRARRDALRVVSLKLSCFLLLQRLDANAASSQEYAQHPGEKSLRCQQGSKAARPWRTTGWSGRHPLNSI
jgi:hypothetical protein